jgi:hypothetical protein
LEHGWVHRRLVGDHLDRLHFVVPMARSRKRRAAVTSRRAATNTSMVDDLADLVDRAVDVAPPARDLHVGLVDLSAVTTACRQGRAASASCGVNLSTQR